MLTYLSRYVHRVAFSKSRILEVTDEKVHFDYKDYRLKDPKDRPIHRQIWLEGEEFLRRFLQLTLQPRFQRIRYYGFLATRNRKTKLRDLQKSLNFLPLPGLQIPWQQLLQQLTGSDPDACPFCHSKTMMFLGYLPRQPTPGRSPPALLNIIIPRRLPP